MISTVASGDVGRYVGPADIMMMYSVTDVQGLNVDLARRCSRNGAHAMAGMVKARLAAAREARRSAPAETAGHRPHDVRRARRPACSSSPPTLRDDYDCLVFHATGTGGQSMEKLVDGGQLGGGDRRHDHRRSATC